MKTDQFKPERQQDFDALLATLSLDTLSAEDIRGCLTLPQQQTSICPYPEELLHGKERRAAVLVPFVREADEWHLLFIRRADNERDRHSGQVAFAGGKEEPEDSSLMHTALRETHEEIGIPAEQIQLLGELPDHYSISNFIIRPVVGVVDWPCEIRMDPAEVAHSFTIPLSWLADPLNREERMRQFSSDAAPMAVTYFEKYNQELLWGATARITLSLLRQLSFIAKD